MNPPPLFTKRILKRIAPLQLGKILACLYGVMGLLIIPLVLFGSIVTSQLPAAQRGIFAFIGIGMAFAAPLFYAAMGFIVGVISAALYNLFAKWVGGIEVEVE
jgi:hypothetical protein